MAYLHSFRSLLLACALAAPLTAFSQLEPTWKAHGGKVLWQSFGTLEYDSEFVMGDRVLTDHQLFDMKTRDALISAKDQKYTIGAHGDTVWIAPDLTAIPMPPRFYVWTPFYFYALPLILSDPGVNLAPEGQAEYEGKQYDLVRATFGKGVGDAPEDFYLCYIDPGTKVLKLAVYIVTYEKLRKAEKTEDIPTSAAVYEEWQTTSGIKLPTKVTLYKWADGKTDGAAKGTLTFTNAALKEARPDPQIFKKPEAAEVDNSHLPAATAE